MRPLDAECRGDLTRPRRGWRHGRVMNDSNLCLRCVFKRKRIAVPTSCAGQLAPPLARERGLGVWGKGGGESREATRSDRAASRSRAEGSGGALSLPPCPRRESNPPHDASSPFRERWAEGLQYFFWGAQGRGLTAPSPRGAPPNPRHPSPDREASRSPSAGSGQAPREGKRR